MPTIHVPTTNGLLRALSILAAARRTTMRAEVNEACQAHVQRLSRLVLSAAEEMTPEGADIDVTSAGNPNARQEE